VRLLFFKDQLAWPRSSGHDVHGFYMMQALAQRGHTVALAHTNPIESRAVQGGGFDLIDLNAISPAEISSNLHLSKSQERWRNYWGISGKMIQKLGALAENWQADVVNVIGLNVLPLLGGINNAVRVWYAGDEWVWHHWSQFRWFKKSTWNEPKDALIKGLYERAYRDVIDRVWMVSEADKRAWKWVTGGTNADVRPNGIDTVHYQPIPQITPVPKSCTFWGRLDFGPNIQALQWFCQNVWPKVIAQEPNATFQIFGFQLGPAVRECVQNLKGVSVTPDLPDLREELAKQAVVVLPFISGGGIKNKLLEAAAMGKPILASPRAAHGLTCGDALKVVSSPREWIDGLLKLWKDPEQQREFGAKARQWVLRDHTWESAAEKAEQELEQAMARRKTQMIV
jgi:glycosyltransferase involved in cell wall biosynthesis